MPSHSVTGGFSAAPQAFAEPAPVPANPWNGEFFDTKQGGVYFKYQFKGFKPGKQQSVVTSSLVLTVMNLLKKSRVVITQKQADVKGTPREMWKLPAGKYGLDSIVMVDNAGVRRAWRPEAKKTFVVRRQTLSNLGLWLLSPQGASELGLKIDMIDNSYIELGNKKESSVAAVIDGFNGLEQEKFAGKEAKKAAEDGNSTKRELRATITTTRQIAMFYKLDLFKYNYHAKAIAEVLGVSDTNIRTCFTDRLDHNAGLKGDVKFTFLLSKLTGTMAKLKRTGGSLNDPKLVECMYYELAQIQFPVPETMIGEVTYSFDVR